MGVWKIGLNNRVVLNLYLLASSQHKMQSRFNLYNVQEATALMAGLLIWGGTKSEVF